MTTHNSTLHVQMGAEIKRKAMAPLAAMGLSAAEAMRLFLHRIAVDQTFSNSRFPNAPTRQAMDEP